MCTTPPGRIRDSIIGYLGAIGCDASLDEIHDAVRADLGLVAPSSVRSYLNLNTPQKFVRTGKGRYSITRIEGIEPVAEPKTSNFVQIGKARLYTSDCMSCWRLSLQIRSTQSLPIRRTEFESTARRSKASCAGAGVGCGAFRRLSTAMSDRHCLGLRFWTMTTGLFCWCSSRILRGCFIGSWFRAAILRLPATRFSRILSRPRSAPEGLRYEAPWCD